MGETIVFAGPCLPSAPTDEWRYLLSGVSLRPPAQRGDILMALGRRPDTIVILDGYYYSVPAVTHKELLYALQSGTRVIGAASMGALRAAEMVRFGMIGVGQVFEWYRDGVVDGDDEVAILHAPAPYAYESSTVALVEVRHALDRLGERGLVAPEAACRLIEVIKPIVFTARTPDRVLGLAAEHLGEEGAEELRLMLETGSIKRDDALLALRAARSDHVPARPEPPLVTVYLSHFREWYLRLPESGSDGWATSHRTFLKGWNVTQILHSGAPEFVTALRRRFLLTSAAASEGVHPEAGAVEAAVARLHAHLDASSCRPCLPEAELVEEARTHAMADAALRHFGTVAAAGSAVAGHLGIETWSGEESLLELLGVQDDLMPPWMLVRAFVFSSALDPAMSVADDAAEIYLAFIRRSRGFRIAERETMALAAELWSCEPDRVSAEAACRGLFRSTHAHGFAPGFGGAMEFLAPAERITAPVNGYADHRSRLRDTPLGHVLART